MRYKAALSLAAASALLTGCRLDLALNVDMAEDGTSSVMFTLYADDEVMSGIDLDTIDLGGVIDSGWAVRGPEAVDGGARLELALNEVSPEDVARVVSQVDDGRLFEVSAVEVVPSIGRTDYRVALSALPEATVADFTDPELAQLFGGEPFGESLAELEARAGGPLDGAVSVTVHASVPGQPAQAASVLLSDEAAGSVDVTATAIDDSVVQSRTQAADARADYDRAWRWVALSWMAAAVLAGALVVVHRRRRPTTRVPTI